MNDNIIKTLTAGLMHGLKFKYCCPYDHNSDRIGIVNEVDMIAQCFCDETGSRYKFGHQTVKVFLFPMSALTKEIEFNGERFVPIVELAKIHGFNCENYRIEIENGTSVVYTEYLKHPSAMEYAESFFEIDEDFTIHSGRCYLIASTVKSTLFYPVKNQVQIFDKIHEWHFNIFNLSPDEYIEVNETNNPYK